MKKLLLISLFSVSCSSAFAQILEKPDSSSSNKVEVFTNDASPFDDGSNGKNLIKLNPLLILNGEIPIYYERQLTNKLSAEIGGGITLKDYVYDLGVMLDEIGIVEHNTGFGFTFKAALKLYPSADPGDFPEGAYFSPEFRFKNYADSYDVTLYDMNGTTSVVTIPAERKFTDFVLLYGYQEEWDSNIYYDAYIGAGLRKKYVETIVSDYNSLTGKDEYVKKINDNFVPLLSIGAKVGFSF